MITHINHASKTSTYRSITTENFLDSLHSEEMKYHASTYRNDDIDALHERIRKKYDIMMEKKQKQQSQK